MQYLGHMLQRDGVETDTHVKYDTIRLMTLKKIRRVNKKCTHPPAHTQSTSMDKKINRVLIQE